MYHFSHPVNHLLQKLFKQSVDGLRIEDKPTLYVMDIHHNYKYSEKHFKERTELYKQFYR
jgi:RNA-splicing ligase RtcB